MKLLIELYKTHSPSGKEDEIRKIVKRELDSLKLSYNEDNKGNVYNLIENTPLLCAHMDQVSNSPITIINEVDDLIFGDGNLGADDKNGIWIILKLLKEFKNISFIFSTNEEAGGDIDILLDDNENIMDTIKYGLVFDRRNGSDVVGVQNEYCTEEFENDILKIAKSFGYKSAVGTWSDCNNLSDYISVVNLSCGYYCAHTKTEYTKVSELKNSLKLGRKLLKKLKKKYNKPEKKSYYQFKRYITWDERKWYDAWGKTYTSDKKYTFAPSDYEEEYEDDEFVDYIFCNDCGEYFEEDDFCYNEHSEPICPLCFSKKIEFVEYSLFDNYYYNRDIPPEKSIRDYEV